MLLLDAVTGRIRFKKMYNKKSEMNVIVMFIILIVSALALSVVYFKFTSTADLNRAVEVCRMSVLTQSKTEFIGSSLFSIECNTRYVVFEKDKVNRGLNPESLKTSTILYNGKKINSFKQLNDYIVDQVVAEEMRICYYEFGEGKVTVFANNDATLDDNVCFICAKISFKVSGQEFKGIYDYMDKTYIKDLSMTYIQYLNQPSLSEANWTTFSNKLYDDRPREGMKIDSDKSYIVVFRKDYDLMSKNGYYVYLLPSTELNKKSGFKCDIIAQ
jgi:hypothetical protein